MDIQHQHHLALLKMRCQDRIVASDDFIEAWNNANDKQKRECYKLLRKLKVKELKIWVAKLTNTQSIMVLRRIASNHCVRNYSNLSKDELLQTLVSRGLINGRIKQLIG